MAINATITGQTKKLGYPCLMEHIPTGNIVLFTNKSKGTVLSVGAHGTSEVGYRSNIWEPSEFILFTRELTLSNKEAIGV